jgi:hypothetical protein
MNLTNYDLKVIENYQEEQLACNLLAKTKKELASLAVELAKELEPYQSTIKDIRAKYEPIKAKLDDIKLKLEKSLSNYRIEQDKIALEIAQKAKAIGNANTVTALQNNTKTDNATTSYVRELKFVAITNPKLVPIDLWSPDEKLIKAEIKAGVSIIPGVEIEETVRMITRQRKGVFDDKSQDNKKIDFLPTNRLGYQV